MQSSVLSPQAPGPLIFIGGGKMAEAIFSRLISQKKLNSDQIVVADKDKDRLNYLFDNYSVRITDSNSEAISDAKVVILAVKPQQMSEAIEEINQKDADRLIISIAAGIKTTLIEEKLLKARVIRAMPNVAAFVGEAITAISAGSKANSDDAKIAKEIFSVIGIVIEVAEEQQNAVTALSGSGPAYFFYLTEALIEAGKQIGLDKENSAKLALQTAIGSGQLLRSDKTPEDLRKMVTSVGGTTEAAIKSFEENNLFGIVKNAVQKARDRAVELSPGD